MSCCVLFFFEVSIKGVRNFGVLIVFGYLDMEFRLGILGGWIDGWRWVDY